MRQLEVNSPKKMHPLVSLTIIYVLFNSLGFPGKYVLRFGYAVELIVNYSSFFIQCILIVWFSWKGSRRLRLIELKKEYAVIYSFLFVVFVVSMIGTSNYREQIISCLRFSVTVLFALCLADHLNVKELLAHFCIAQLLMIIATTCYSLFFSTYDVWGKFNSIYYLGLSETKNMMAEELCLGIILGAMYFKLKKEESGRITLKLLVLVVFLEIQIIFLILTHGMGAWVTCAAVVLIIIFYRGKHRWNLGLVWALISVGFLVSASYILPYFEPLLNALGKDAMLSNRVPLWARLVAIIRMKNPLVGFGFGHFWRDEEALFLVHFGFHPEAYLGHMTSGAHNSIMELWINTGLIGVISFIAMEIWVFRRMHSLDKVRFFFCLSFMAYFLFSGLLERLWSTYGYNMILLFVAAGYACQGRAEQTTRTEDMTEKESPENSG